MGLTLTVFFHGNFGLNREFMAGIIRLALQHPGQRDAELAKPFGYGAPFATKYRYWLHKTGIANFGRPLTLTETGKVIWLHDPNFDKTITKWVMHHELAGDPERAEAWHFFIREFRPLNRTFTRDSLQHGLMIKLRHHDEVHFGPKSKMNSVIVRKLIECYADPKGLGDLGIVKSNDRVHYRFEAPRQLGPWQTPSQLDKAYRVSTT